jgi:hypothetical protein
MRSASTAGIKRLYSLGALEENGQRPISFFIQSWTLSVKR